MIEIGLSEAKRKYPFLERLIHSYEKNQIFDSSEDLDFYYLHPTNLDDHRVTVHEYEHWALYVVRSGQAVLESVDMKMGVEHISPPRNWIAGPAPDDDDYTLPGECVKEALQRISMTDVSYVILHGSANRSYSFNKIYLSNKWPF